MIILMGAVGSGKSEQATRLENRLSYPRISTSQILQSHLTPEREAQMHAGDLISDNEMIELLEPELTKLESAHQEYLLDGFPRSLPQAKWLVKKINEGKIKLTAIIKLNVSNQAVLSRLLKRGRQDDTEEVIVHRLKTYEETTTPVIDYLSQNGIKVYEIDGEVAPDQVEQQINNVLEKT